MITIDGSEGEGGGQILRSSLALSLITGQPMVLDNIRANRNKPGLMRQHLTCVNAARAIGAAEVEGAHLRSSRVVFRPGSVSAGDYHFAVGTAGSLHLVLQTILPPLMLADGPSRVVLEGGTHNPMAPPFEFLQRSFLPLLAKMGPSVKLTRERSGFYPAGGGRVVAEITPAKLRALDLSTRGEVQQIRATAIVSNLSKRIAKRELAVLGEQLDLHRSVLDVRVDDSPGPGNAVFVQVDCEHLSAVFFGFGEKRKSAERVATELANEVKGWLSAGVPVEEYLQDQLLLPMVLGEGGSFRTVAPSLHATTNAQILERFTGTQTRITADGDTWVFEVKR